MIAAAVTKLLQCFVAIHLVCIYIENVHSTDLNNMYKNKYI